MHPALIVVIVAALLPAATGLAQAPPPDPFLDGYSFEDTNWYSDLNFPPLAFTNLASVSNFWGNSLLLDTTNLEPSFLSYRILDTNTYIDEGFWFTNLDLRAGAVIAFVLPDWASADTNQNGQGPGSVGFLLAAGDWSSGSPEGLWAIYVDSAGTNIYFGGVSNSVATTYVSAPISWASNSIHMISLSYSTNSALYLDGQYVASGGPVTIVPSTNVWSNGFNIGSDNAGYEQFRGIFLDVETYNTNITLFARGTNYFTDGWEETTNEYYTWLAAQSGFHPDGGGGIGHPPTPTNTVNTNYAAYTNFWLLVTHSDSDVQVDLINAAQGLTYVILTNSHLQSVTSTNWQPWVTLVGTNTVMPAPPLTPGPRDLFFVAELVWSSCTNSSPPIPDWWAMLYFNSLCPSPTGNPSGDGIDNLDKYVMGLNPNVAYVSTLLIEPPGGNYVSTPSISIFSLAGASIKYTTDGSTPSATNGTTISSGVPLTNLPGGNFTLKAWESGLVSNVPVIANYSIIAGLPTFSIPSGLYGAGTTVQITALPTNAVVRYTTNGTVPMTNSTIIQPTNLIVLLTNESIEAAAWVGTNVGPVASAVFFVEEPPSNDNFSNAITLTGSAGEFRGTTVGSTIEPFETANPEDNFYWSANTQHSVWYEWTAPSNGNVFFDLSKCNIASTTVISFYCFPTNTGPNPINLVPAESFDNSDYTSMDLEATQSVDYYICITAVLPGAFDISWEYPGATLTPIFTPDAGTYLTNELIKIYDNDTNAVIHYTLDGSDPTTNGPAILSGAALMISETTALKAAAWRAGLNESAVKTALYTINPASTNPTMTASAPVLSPINTNFASSVTVTLTCTNTGSIVYYTLDGSIPTSASASVSSGGTVTVTNSVMLNASGWVTNMNFSSITTGIYVRNGADTAQDGILDTTALLIGANPFVSDANAINPNPFAHGLNNMQVSQNQSVLLADNYSTLNDGIPDWWMVQNGYNVTTPSNALGRNGQTLLTSFLAGLSPNNPSSLPGQLPPIDFHIVHGPSNSLVMVLDTINPSVVTYFLYCTPIDTSTGNQSGAAVIEQFDANETMTLPGSGSGRYFQLTNALLPGSWLFTLQGVNNNGLRSTTSGNTFAKNYEQCTPFGEGSTPALEYPGWGRYSGIAIPVVGYTNLNNQKWPLLIQMLRAESDTWVDTDPSDIGWTGGSSGPVVFDDKVPARGDDRNVLGHVDVSI